MTSYSDEEKTYSQKEWNDFVSNVQSKIQLWTETYPVTGYCYELSTLGTDVHSLTLHLKSRVHTIWVFEVHVFPAPNRSIYFSSLEKEVDDVEASSFDEAEKQINHVFECSEFRFVLEELQKIEENKRRKK